MKKIFALFIVLILICCNSQKKYSDFDYSYSRSGGYEPVYENFLIKGNKAHYSLEGRGKKIKKNFEISNDELKSIEKTLTENNFRTIQEDFKKIYDKEKIAIKVKSGPNANSKSDASLIIPSDQKRWDKIVSFFQTLLNSKLNKSAK